MAAASAFTRNTVNDLMVILLRKRIPRIVFPDKPVMLAGRHTVWALQPLQVPQMSLTKFFKRDRLVFSTGITVKKMKYETAA